MLFALFGSYYKYILVRQSDRKCKRYIPVVIANNYIDNAICIKVYPKQTKTL